MIRLLCSIGLIWLLAVDMVFLELKCTSVLLWPSSHPADIKVGSRKSEIGSRKSEVGSWKLEVRSPKTEVRNLEKSEVGSPSSFVGYDRICQIHVMLMT